MKVGGNDFFKLKSHSKVEKVKTLKQIHSFQTKCVCLEGVESVSMNCLVLGQNLTLKISP
jgi:hypothetical protein